MNRFASIMLAVIGLVLFAAAPAMAATASNPSEYQGYGDMYYTDSAGNYQVVLPDGGTVLAFCADREIALNNTASFTTASATTMAGAASAAYVGVHHADLGTPSTDGSAEASATQLVIWHYLSGLEITAESTSYEPVYTRAIDLMDAYMAAGEPAVAAGPSVYSLAADATVGTSTVTFTATFTADGVGVPDRQVLFTAEDGSSLVATTDNDGVASVFATSAGTRTVSVSGIFPAGTILIADDGSQPLLTVEPFAQMLSVDVSAVANFVPSTTTTTMVTTVTTGSSDLPYTGGGLSLMWLLVLVPAGVLGLRLVRHGLHEV